MISQEKGLSIGMVTPFSILSGPLSQSGVKYFIINGAIPEVAQR